MGSPNKEYPWSVRFEGFPERVPAAAEKQGVLLVRGIPLRLNGAALEVEVRRNGWPLPTMVLVPQDGDVGMIVPSGEYAIDTVKMPSVGWSVSFDPNEITKTVYSGRVTSLTFSEVHWPQTLE
jgi:hypothetical protein